MPSFNVGIQTTIIGMGVVFSVLIILSIFTWLLSKIIDGGIERKAAKKRAAAETVAPPAPVAAPPAAPAGISPRTVAAIMTAVSVASGIPATNLHFTAIRRSDGVNNAWSASGTNDIISSRQTYL